MGPSELHHRVCCQKREIILLMAPSTIPAGLLTCVGEAPSLSRTRPSYSAELQDKPAGGPPGTSA